MENRLAKEASPYLLQHAHNPVDWFPWGPEALSRARAEDRPILLSIGYSACHWCHVMERESFENEDIARRMNELFVNVKVDREERPGPGPDLPAHGAAPRPQRRLAPDGVSHAGGQALLRGDVFPARRSPRHAGVPQDPRRHLRGLSLAPRGRRAAGQGAERRHLRGGIPRAGRGHVGLRPGP